MLADADLATVGRMLGDEHRARVLLALMGGEPLAAGELAARAGASASLASSHLAKLLESGLVSVTRRGRQRYYSLSGPQVARAIESLLAISPPRAAHGLRESKRGEAIRDARTCYDHLAGRVGVAVTDALEQRRALTPTASGWDLTSRGERLLGDLGVDLHSLRGERRTFLRPCLDWTERRPHLAGGLGAAIASRFFELGWIRRLPGSRAVQVTPEGEAELLARLGVPL